jgi:protein involved in temperature-dependent protein secretion
MKAQLEKIKELIRLNKSLILSIQAHPDYTGEKNEEWTDLTSIAIDCQHDAEIALQELKEMEATAIPAKALKKKGTEEW